MIALYLEHMPATSLGRMTQPYMQRYQHVLLANSITTHAWPTAMVVWVLLLKTQSKF